MLRCRFFGVAFGLVVALAVAWVAVPHPGAPGGGEAAIASDGALRHAVAAGHPLSCKPSPPVTVTLARGAGPGRWSVQLAALESAPQVEVTLGADTPGIEPRVVWRGAMRAGERRTLDLRFDAPAAGSDVWARAVVVTGPGAMLQSRAVLAAGGIAPKQADAGRLVVDARGRAVVEYTGVQGGAR